jgi:hypothetical protein
MVCLSLILFGVAAVKLSYPYGGHDDAVIVMQLRGSDVLEYRYGVVLWLRG